MQNRENPYLSVTGMMDAKSKNLDTELVGIAETLFFIDADESPFDCENKYHKHFRAYLAGFVRSAERIITNEV